MSRPLVVLDVDDTLYLERDYVRSGFRAVADHVRNICGIEDLFERAWALYAAGVRRSTFDDLRRDDPRLAAALLTDEMVAVYRAHVPRISLESDARDFLERVHGFADLAVVTDGPAQSQWNKARALGLERWIAEIIVTDERGAGWVKPSVRAFEHLQRLFDADSARCVYFGDNPRKDFVGPLALGWHAVRVRRQHGLYVEQELTGRVDGTISTFDGQLQYIRDLLTTRSEAPSAANLVFESSTGGA